MLADIQCFGNLPPSAVTRLEHAGYAVDPPDGTVIFARGAPANAIYAIIGGDGCVRIGASNAHSKRSMLHIFMAGDIFGEIAVMDGGMRGTEAVAVGRVRLWRIGAVAFLDELHSEPLLGVALARMLAQRLRHTRVLLHDATFASLESRLARQLLYLAGLDARKTDEGLLIHGRFRQGDLADLLGVTTRSIIKVLNNWRTRGIVVYDTNRALLTIRQKDALCAMIEDS